MTTRVADHSSESINRSIQREIDAHVHFYARHPELIERRLEELDAEWDIERWLETNASALILTGTLLGAFVHRRWLMLPGVVSTFLLQHALQGWCPPVEVFRRLGIRTQDEILRERYALRAVRGDLDAVAETNADPDDHARHVLHAIRGDD